MEKRGTAKVIWPHQARVKEELTIETGDVITILEEHNTGWWKGELNGKVSYPNFIMYVLVLKQLSYAGRVLSCQLL